MALFKRPENRWGAKSNATGFLNYESDEKMARIVTSQSFLDRAIVAKKRKASDYSVLLSPVFEVDGASYQIVMDGHHALAAAKLDGVAPCYRIASSTEDRLVGLLEDDVEMFLLHAARDDLFFDVDSGEYIRSDSFFWPVGDDDELPKRLDWPKLRRR